MAGNENEHSLEAAWIKELAGILDQTGLNEIEIEKDNVRLRVARHAPTSSATIAVPTPVDPSPAPIPVAATTTAPPTEIPAGAVLSPMVGTAYLSPSPGADPFAKEGDTVSEGQTVMIVEAMKTMNPISAPASGRITKILVKDAQPVEFNEPLLVIE